MQSNQAAAPVQGRLLFCAFITKIDQIFWYI